MKALYITFVTLLCVCGFSHPGCCQEKIWYTSGGLANCNTDGSNVQGSSWTNREIYGENPGFIMQASTGDIYAVNTEGGEENEEDYGSYGAIVRISNSGIQRILGLGYNEQRAFLTEGKDGYIYGVRSSAFDYYLFRFRLDGTNYSQHYFATYGMRASELTTAAGGEIMGTTYYHLYKFKPDMSGIIKVYAYQKATGNSPVGKLHQSNDGYLYGVTKLGGAGNYGVVYRVKPTGEDYKVLHEFNITNGRYPDRGLAEDSHGNLYGVTRQGGKYHKGVLFKIGKDGSGFEVLYHFKTVGEYNDYDERDLPASLQLDKNGTLIGEAPGHYKHSMFMFSLVTKEYTRPFSDNVTISDVNLFREVTPSIEVLRPANGAVNVPVNDTHRVTFVQGASSYTAEFSTDPTFATNVLTSTYPSSSNLPRVNLAWNTKYYTRAKSSLWPYYGKVTSFTTRTAESLSFISNPKNGATGVEAPVLKITANQISGAKRYVIEISTSGDFSAGVIRKESTSDYQRTLTFNDLQYSTTYYGRMKTDISGYGKVTSFTTKAAPEELMMLAKEPVTADVHPNPSSGYFHLAVTTSSQADARVTITKLTGEVVSTHSLPAGETLDVGNELPKGIYILRIMSDQHVITKRLVKE